MRTSEQIKVEIAEKFGFVPPFFGPAQQNPQVLENLWQQTLSAYVNNPLSPLFKEKLFAYLSRYCAVPYWIICHSCSLRSLGVRAREVLELLESPPPTETEIDSHLKVLTLAPGGLTVLPESNSVFEESLLYCAIFIALELEPAEYCRSVLHRLLGPVNYQYLITFVAYVRTCHVWMEAHPEVAYEADKRVQDHLGVLLEEAPGLADLFQNYVQRVRRERQTLAERVAESTSRKRYQEALQESEERFCLLVESVRDYAILMLDPNGHITSWNAGAERIKGYQANEIIGKHFSCFYTSEDIQRGFPNRALQVAAAEGRVEDKSWRVRKDGSRFWAHVVITALRDKEGNLQGFSKVSRDITEHQQNQEALRQRQSEERLRLALEAARMGTWDWDITSGKVSYSINTQVNLGLAPGCFDGTYNSFLANVHPEDYELVTTAARRTIESSADYDIEFRVIWPDGTVHWVASKGQVYYDKTGSKAVYMAGVDMDITSRKQTEAALRESEERFQAFMNNSPTLAFMKNNEGRYVYFNKPYEHLFNRKLGDLVGLTDFDWLPEQTARRVRENDLAVLSTGQPAEDLEAVTTPDGDTQYWLFLKFPFHDVAGRQLVGGVAVDVTARQQAEAELYKALAKEKELNELKSQFVSITSHEFRTPLTTILSSAEMLETYGHKWVEQKKLEHLHRIQTAAETMLQQVDDVLLVSKAEAGKQEVKPDTLDLASFCCDLVEQMQLIAGAKHTIDFVTQGQCTNVCLDQRLLRHILTNLLSNAIKYSPAGGTVHFNVVCDQKAAIFRITDQGIGIAEADQALLFESFHRGSNVGKISGTGLGLAIVKNFVDLHGGEIAVASVVGVGTTFTVTIPLHN